MPAPGDAHLCAQCHQAGGGCCRADADGVEYMFGLTRGEIEGMARASGLEPWQFVVADQASPRFLEFLDSLHPLFRQTMPRGRRLRLRLETDGGCCFLGPEGCRLSREARPLYCRLYPFFVNPHGRLMVLSSPACLAQQGARSWREVLGRLGQDEATVRELFGRLQHLATEHEAARPLELA
ncbi:MAG: YkgJ family cysteine cluster protein [Desulfarculus sp.]|nr:YkgJ family cysteine cluster protein [Desulfarculus sp.]